MNRALLALLVTSLLIGASFAQMGPPKPAPELKKLDYFTGTWVSEGDMKPGPMGPGGKITMNQDGKWMDGNFFVVIHADFKAAAMGNGTNIAFLGYDPQDKVYTYDEFNSTGEVVHAKGQRRGRYMDLDE